MAFTKITNAELNAVGATTQPNVPTIGATALKQVFDAPAKQVVAPKVNNLIDELQASTAAADLGAVAPTGRTGTSVQSVLNSISSDLGNAEAQSHAHPNKAVIDKFADDGTGLTYDGNPIRGAVESVNGKDGTVVLTASDVGALPTSTPIPTKTSDLTNDSGFITSGDIPTIPTKTSDLTNDSNFVADASYVHTDNNYDASAKGIVDGATAAIAAKSTVAWNQNITTGQKIATVTIDGTPTDVYAPTGGGGGGGAVDSVNGQTGIVTLGVGDLDDVSISSLASQQTIVYDGTEWGNETLADVALSGAYADLTGQPILATIATTGAYADTTGKPSINGHTLSGNQTASDLGLASSSDIPTVDQSYNAISTHAQSGTAVADALTNYYDKSEIDAQEKNLVSYGGAVTFANLPALSAANVNKFWLVTDSFTTTSDFVVGAGVTMPADSHIAIINTGTDASPIYKYDDFGGFIDTSALQSKTIPSMTVKGAAVATVENALTAINSGLDDWTATATVGSSGVVTFSGLSDSLSYKIFYTLPSGDSSYAYTKVNKSGSGTSVTLKFTTNAPSGTVCILRVLK